MLVLYCYQYFAQELNNKVDLPSVILYLTNEENFLVLLSIAPLLNMQVHVHIMCIILIMVGYIHAHFMVVLMR